MGGLIKQIQQARNTSTGAIVIVEPIVVDGPSLSYRLDSRDLLRPLAPELVQTERAIFSGWKNVRTWWDLVDAESQQQRLLLSGQWHASHVQSPTQSPHEGPSITMDALGTSSQVPEGEVLSTSDESNNDNEEVDEAVTNAPSGQVVRATPSRQPKVLLGPSLKAQLDGGYVWRLGFFFDVDMSMVDEPRHVCTNHRVVDDHNVEKVYQLLLASHSRRRVSALTLRPINCRLPDGTVWDFGGVGGKTKILEAYQSYLGQDDTEASRAAFLGCVKWEPVDGQHVRLACVQLARAALNEGRITQEVFDTVFARRPANFVVYNEEHLYMETSRRVNIANMAKRPTVPVANTLEKIRDTWKHFGMIGPFKKGEASEAVHRRAAFYMTLFAATGIEPTKEAYTLADLRTKFDVYLYFACLESTSAHEAVQKMCNDYDQGLTQFSKPRAQHGGIPRPRSDFVITWLRPLRSCFEPDIESLAKKCSANVEGVQTIFFDQLPKVVEDYKKRYAVQNAMRWMVESCNPGLHSWDELMSLPIRPYATAKELKNLMEEAGPDFVAKWRWPACNSIKAQRQHEHLIPQRIAVWMRQKIIRST